MGGELGPAAPLSLQPLGSVLEREKNDMLILQGKGLAREKHAARPFAFVVPKEEGWEKRGSIFTRARRISSASLVL